jgi:uncharacterized protein
LEILQSFKAPFAADIVWRFFHDVEAVVGCLPGAALTAPPDAGKLALSMSVKLGPIVAQFAGDGAMRLDEAARRGSIAGGGSDRRSGSRIKGEAAFSLHEEGTDETRIDIRVDYAIAGSLAQFSRGGVVRELAERLTRQFSDNLRTMLAAQASAPAPAGESAGPAPDAAPTSDVGSPPPAHAASAPFDFGRLFWTVLIGRLKRWLRLSPRA